MRSDEQLTDLNTWLLAFLFILSLHLPQTRIPSYFPLAFSLQNCLWIVLSCFVQSLSIVWFFVTHGQQHRRLPCPSTIPRVCSNSCPSSWWFHTTISSCHQLLVLPSIFPSIRGYTNVLALHIMWPKHWSFILPMNIQDWFPLGLTDLIS